MIFSATNQAILRSLYYNSLQSIADLSLAIGKSVPKITKSTIELIDSELITTEGLAPSTGGRRAMHYSLNSDKFPLILAIACDQFITTIGLFDFSNKEINIPQKIHLDLKKEKHPVLILQNAIEQYLSPEQRANLAAVGITIPGFVDAESRINQSYPPDHELYNIAPKLEKFLGAPTFIDNDSTAIAIAEQKFGKAIGTKNALIVNLNWGVGLGMIIEDQLFKGHSGFAGEFSHIPLSTNNQLCSCGKRGCLEVEASLIAAVNYTIGQIKEGIGSKLSSSYLKTSNIDIDELMDAALEGDQVAIKAFSKVGYMLGKGIATLIHIISPKKIIISGKGAKIGNILMPQIQTSLFEFTLQRISQHTEIEISTLSNVQLLGSLCITIDQMDWKNIKIKRNVLK